MNPLSYQDALCLVFTYHFADCAIFKSEQVEQGQAFKLLREKGIDPEDGGAVTDAYHKLVEDTAGDILPDEWETTFDYWGGKCYAHKPGWNAPKSETIMAGESSRYLCCTSVAAIREELQRFSQFQLAAC